MQKFMLALLFTMLTSLSFAQTFSVTTNHVMFSGLPSWNEIPSPYWMPVIHNLSGDTIELRWVRAEETYTNNWRSSLCREMYCYSMQDDSGSWQLLPGDSDMLYAHIYPYNYADTGSVIVKIFDVNNPADSVRVMFQCDASVGIQENNFYSSVITDPERHEVAINLNTEGVVVLRDNLGREIARQNVVPMTTYHLNAADAGLYFITFINREGETETRKLIL